MPIITCSNSINLLDSNFDGLGGCGDVNIDLTTFELTPLSEVTNVDEFNKIIYTQFIDAKNRQTISAYPLLRLLYERYLTSDNCDVLSNGYNYSDMDGITELVGTYWVDLVEQFIPSTTIWGSTYVYRNTVFDSQKYAYKSNTLFVCEDPSNQFPFSAISSDCNTEVIKVQMTSDSLSTTGATPFDSSNFFSCENYTYCDCVWTMTNYCFSEFVGAVIDDTEFAGYCEDTLYIEPVQLYVSLMTAPGCSGPYQTWDPINRIFTQVLKVTDAAFVPITENYQYTVTPYGTNISGITMTATSIDVSTIQIDWSIPLSAPDPIQQTTCPGYYVSTTVSNGFPPSLKPIWDVIPLIKITDPVFNCEITTTFIYLGGVSTRD